MKHHIGASAVFLALLSITACSSDSRSSLETDLRSVATDVADAAGEAADDAAEVLARNIATQQGEEQFKNAGQELSGPLTCTADVRDGVAQIDIFFLGQATGCSANCAANKRPCCWTSAQYSAADRTRTGANCTAA